MSGSREKKSVYEGKKITLIGAMSKSRAQITRELKDKGVHVVSTVTKQTDILLCSVEEFQKGTHIKYQKSKKMGIQIMSEDDFWNAFENTDNLLAQDLDINASSSVQNTFETHIAKEDISRKKCP